MYYESNNGGSYALSVRTDVTMLVTLQSDNTMSRTYRTILDTYCPCCESFDCDGVIFEDGRVRFTPHNHVVRKRKVQDKDMRNTWMAGPPKSWQQARERQYRARVKDALRNGRMPPKFVKNHKADWL